MRFTLRLSQQIDFIKCIHTAGDLCALCWVHAKCVVYKSSSMCFAYVSKVDSFEYAIIIHALSCWSFWKSFMFHSICIFRQNYFLYSYECRIVVCSYYFDWNFEPSQLGDLIVQKIEKKKHFSRLVFGFRPITHERLGVYYLLSSAET